MINDNKSKIEYEENTVMVNQDDAPIDGADTSSDEFITVPFDPTKIRVDTKNTQMDALIKRMKNGEIDLAPDFQRRAGIWNDGAQSRLIESMLIRIPLPAFYMDATNEDKWLVVDGLQRLTAIKRFTIDQSLLLSGLEFLTDYNGSSFDELPRGLQRRIEETDIVVYQIQPGTPDRLKFDIFRRINTGGEPLSAQEIRHALNQGQITEYLRVLASSSEFKKATDYGISPKRMDDRECVLRFFAFCIAKPEGYSVDNFDNFLNNIMSAANKMPVEELDVLVGRFLRAMKASSAIFGKDAFRKRYNLNSPRHPVNKALFEAWSVNFDLLSDDEIEVLISKKRRLQEEFALRMRGDTDFDKSVSQGTGSVSRVKNRFRVVGEIIKGVLKC